MTEAITGVNMPGTQVEMGLGLRPSNISQIPKLGKK
jgi:hypothetical protein